MEQKSELTIGKTIFFLIALFVIQSILVALFMIIYGAVYTILNPGVPSSELTSIISSSSLLNVINFLFIELSLFFFALILGHKYKTSVISLFQVKKINVMLTTFIFIFSIFFLVVSSELENIFASLFGRITIIGEFIINISKIPGIVGLIASIFVIGVLPAIAEEALFRGVIQKNLYLRYGILKALIITSLLFALIHVNPSGIVSIFLLGLMLGYLYLKTENLIYPIILHFFYNTFATLLTRFKVFEVKGLTADLGKVELVPVTIFLPSVIFSVLLALIIHKIIKSKVNNELGNDVTS